MAKPARILVVEDESIVAKDIQRILKRLGYETLPSVTRGDKAVENVDSLKPNLVLMDIRLKGKMDGVEAAEIIRAKYGIPVVYLTAYSDETTLQRAKITEPFGYVLKPFDIREIHTAVEMALYRHKLERSLKEKEESLRAVVETAHEAIITVDFQGNIILWNPTAVTIFGFLAEEVMGKPFYYLIPDELQQNFRKEFAMLMETGSSKYLGRTTEIVGFRKDGKSFFLEFSVALYKTRGETFCTAILRDVTRRKEAERALKESEDRSRVVSELTSDYAYSLEIGKNNELSIEWVTGAFSAITGFSVQHIKEMGGWLSIVIPEDRAVVTQQINSLLKGKQSTVEYRIETNDKQIRWQRNYGRPYRNENSKRVTHIHGAVQDITEYLKTQEMLRESEVRFRGITERSIDAIFSLDIKGSFTYTSPAVKSITGFKPDEMIGKSFEEYGKINERKKVLNVLKILGDGENVENLQMKWMCKDDSIIDVEINASPILKNQKIIGFQGTMRDITQRKKVEEKLIRSQEQLRDLAAHLQSVREEERSLIAREIHDELGQSLTALKIDVSWLGGKIVDLPAELKEKIASMQSLISRTINNVKRISTELRPGLLDDLGLAAAVEFHAEEFQGRTNIMCDVVIEPDDIDLDFDRSTALFRILQEALTNVARHSKATGVQIHLIQSKDSILLQVEDNGIGISQDELLHPKSFGIIGIQERAHFLNGEVKIVGKPNKGTEITVVMPIKPGGAGK